MTAQITRSLFASPNYYNRSQREKNPFGYETSAPFFKQHSSPSYLLFPYLGNCLTPICASLSLKLNLTRTHQITDHNAEIIKFCEVGNLEKAMDLLCELENSNLDAKTYCSLLQLCAESKSLRYGQMVHSIMDSNGVEIDALLGTKLVFMYVNCGDLGKGRRVFDEIANEKVFLWNLLINEYAKIGNFEESVFLFRKMQELGVEPSSHTFSSIFKCFAALGGVLEGERVHGYLLRLGFGSYNTVVNSMISFYCKCGLIESACKLFDELGDRDVITWNSMISGCVVNGLAEKGLEFFKDMGSSGVSVDFATIVCALAACASSGSLTLGRAIHGHALKENFDRKLKCSNTLLDMYSKCGDLDSATRVFAKMGERSVVAWTSMIVGYTRVGLSKKAIELFLDMKRECIRPDSYTVSSILHACACNGSLQKGKEVHNYIRESNMQSLPVSNALMDMYAKCGSMEESYRVFSEMPSKDIVSWNTMIGGYSKNGHPNEALKLFFEMQSKLKPDNVTISCILPACASLGTLNKGREIHAYILRNRLSLNHYIMNALVDMYVKCGVLVLARSLFDMIPAKDLVTWTIMIAGYGMHGFGGEAVATFKKMQHEGVEPDEVSFTCILYACSHSGLIDEGWRFYDIMKNDCKIEPKLDHYACMVDLLSRAGKLSAAYKFVKAMPIKPDATIWGALLRGCRIHHDVKLAEKVAENVFELEPGNTGYYVLLANIYAEAEKWEEVKKLRERIGAHGLRKNPGCSWTEIEGKVYIFVAGGTQHPDARKIQSLLRKLRKHMKEEGYMPKLKYALVNANEMEKEEALCGHSEKLAMAFGILNLPPGETIRVTKNLRICADCHEMARFISKTAGRQIVLRDSNRFHHFKDGFCSCRGYW